MADKFQFVTPVGRFVSGDMTKKREKDNQGRPIDADKQRFEFGIAFQKTDPQIGVLIQQIAQYAYTEYGKTAPHVAQRVANWMNTLDGFSMKISNGDEPNSQGKVNPNTVGHWVFWFSTALDPIGAIAPSNAQIPLDRIKRGWFVDVAGSAAINGLTDNNAGIYMNPTVIRLVAEGEEIVGGVDPQQVFANHGAPAQLPPGARPLGSAPSLPPGSGMPGVGMPQQPAQMPPGMMPGQPMQMPGNGGAPVQQPTFAQPQAGYGAPNGGFMPPATPAPGGMPQAAPAGMQPFGAVGGGNPTASPGNGYPAYPGVLGMPQQ